LQGQLLTVNACLLVTCSLQSTCPVIRGHATCTEMGELLLIAFAIIESRHGTVPAHLVRINQTFAFNSEPKFDH